MKKKRADLAIDTNVFVHASRPADAMFAEAVTFLKSFHSTNLSIGVDPGFALDAAANRSLIGSEYVKWILPLPPGSLGSAVLTSLAASARVKELELSLEASEHKSIKKFIKRSKPRDRTFLKIAYLTDRKELVTHDFEDFSEKKRKNIKSDLGVVVCTGGEWTE